MVESEARELFDACRKESRGCLGLAKLGGLDLGDSFDDDGDVVTDIRGRTLLEFSVVKNRQHVVLELIHTELLRYRRGAKRKRKSFR